MTITNIYRLRRVVRHYAELRQLCELDTDTLGALIELALAAEDVAYAFECRCAPDYTERGLHGPECLYEEAAGLRAALELFDWRDN